MFKNSDVVEVVDGSYAMVFDAGTGAELKRDPIACGGPRKFTVIAEVDNLPVEQVPWSKGQHNDIILRDESRPGLVVFSQKRFCRLVPKEVPVNRPIKLTRKQLLFALSKLEHDQSTISLDGIGGSVEIVKYDNSDKAPFLPSTEKEIAEIETLLNLRRNLKGN